MKKWWVAFTLLVLLAGCVKTVPVNEAPKVTETEATAGTAATSPAESSASTASPAKFKIINEFGFRNPPSINGTVKNIGNSTGNVKIIARVLYAGVISAENTETINDMKPGDTANFGIPFDKTTQWTAFKIVLE